MDRSNITISSVAANSRAQTYEAVHKPREIEFAMFTSGARMLGGNVLEATLLMVGACGTAAIVLFAEKALLYVGLAVGAALLLAYALSAFVSGNSQGLIPVWVLLYPLGYYFLSFPREHPIVTLDRAFVAILGAVLVAQLLQHPQPLPKAIRYAGLCWAGFIGAALLSLRAVRGHDLLYSLRVLIDAFVLPGVLALYVIRNFNVRRYLSALNVVVCLMSIYLAAIGLAEAVLSQDLLPIGNNTPFFAGTDVRIFRANGAFLSGSTYALVGVINFLLICFFQRSAGPRLPNWQRGLQWIGKLASLMVSMISMHRGIVVTWVVIGVIEFWQNRRSPMWWQRTAWKRVALLAGFLAALLTVKTKVPDIYEDRVAGPGNFYSRIAQDRQSLEVFLDHVWLGAGFQQFTNVVSEERKYRFFFNGASSVDYAHNTLANVAAETGLLGVSFFTVSHLLLLAACRKLLLRGVPGRLALWASINIFTAYWVFGMDVSSGYYSELNMWYMFAIAICIRYAYTETHASRLDLVGAKAFRNPFMRTYFIPNQAL